MARDAQRSVVVVGAGAAGTMAAIFAARAGAAVALLEGSKQGGRKILISGGGRCNVLPMRVDESRFVTDSSINTLRRILRSWPLTEQRAFFENDVGIALVDEPESAKVFPASHKAAEVRDGLLALATRSGATVAMHACVTDIRPEGARWRIEVGARPPLIADAVVIATGGLSVPATGSDGAGLRFARALGHVLHPTYAALTPILSHDGPFGTLAGVSLAVTLTARSRERSVTAKGGFLFTHRGYSGPAVLDVSHVLVRARAAGGPPATLLANWTALDDAEWTQILRPHGSRTVTGALRARLPERLAAVLLAVADVDPARSLADLRRDERLRLVDTLVRCPLPWTGDEGYKKAEVTGGGVSLAEINPKTMESRRHAGLYFCGEVLDAFGPIGGYNFCWAWATGRNAGIAAGAVATSRAAANPAASSRDA